MLLVTRQTTIVVCMQRICCAIRLHRRRPTVRAWSTEHVALAGCVMLFVHPAAWLTGWCHSCQVDIWHCASVDRGLVHRMHGRGNAGILMAAITAAMQALQQSTQREGSGRCAARAMRVLVAFCRCREETKAASAPVPMPRPSERAAGAARAANAFLGSPHQPAANTGSGRDVLFSAALC